MKSFVMGLILLVGAGCASAPPKQVIVISTQTLESALGIAQDAERSLCFTSPTTQSGPVCTNPAAATLGLTSLTTCPTPTGGTVPCTVHVKISQAFVQAFTYEGQLATALQTWTIATGIPTSLSQVQAQAQAILAVIQALPLSSQIAAVLTDIQAIITQATNISSAITSAMSAGS
jgi:hypothetical protein